MLSADTGGVDYEYIINLCFPLNEGGSCGKSATSAVSNLNLVHINIIIIYMHDWACESREYLHIEFSLSLNFKLS